VTHNRVMKYTYNIRMIKSRSTKGAGHVARMGKNTKAHKLWWESQKETDNLQDQDISGWMY
jgi:hypothetical protein